MKDQALGSSPYSPRISRRQFIKLAVMAGLLSGCGPLKDVATPAPTGMPSPTTTPAPTDVPAATAPAAPTTVPTSTPTATVPLRPIPARPEIIKFYPDGPSTVVHTHHGGVWDGHTLVPGAIRQMLDASITALTGLQDADAAWAALFRPNEQIAIKVNTIEGSIAFTHVPLVIAVTERLQEVGIPPEQLVVFDRRTDELLYAGFPVNQHDAGVRCYGTDGSYTTGWTIAGRSTGLTDILLSCDALINMPILKQHMYAGNSFAMKNHFGIIYNPSTYHPPRTGDAIVEINALPDIRDRTRLIIGDALKIVFGDHWTDEETGDSILMSFDPVAHDTAGLQLWSAIKEARGENPAAYLDMATVWLKGSADLGLGTNDSEYIELIEANLG